MSTRRYWLFVTSLDNILCQNVIFEFPQFLTFSDFFLHQKNVCMRYKFFLFFISSISSSSFFTYPFDGQSLNYLVSFLGGMCVDLVSVCNMSKSRFHSNFGMTL